MTGNSAGLGQEMQAFYEKKKNMETQIQKEPQGNGRAIALIPVLVVLLAETLIFITRIKEAVWLHTSLLIVLSVSSIILKDPEMRRLYQAFMLLPILRLVNLSMPVFFDITLYSFLFVYAPLAIPVTILAMNQKLTREELGLTTKKLWLYLPLSILVGLALGLGEYLTIRPSYLIPDLSVPSLLELSMIMVLFVGLTEEIVFRSILQTKLEGVFGMSGGLVLASLLFGIMHSGYGTPFEIVYTMFVGMTMGFMFQKTRSLPFIALVHGFTNVFLFGVLPHLGASLGFF